MKKYELIGEPNDKGLRRIRALRSFGDISLGEIGGWVESEDNLCHAGDCWVYNEAQVYGEAQVFNDAQIHGRAQVCGEAKVFETARVFQRAQVFDGAHVYASAQVYGNAQVFGEARAYGMAHIHSNAQVYAAAEVCGQALVQGGAQVYGNAVLRVGYFTRPGIHRTPRVIVGTVFPVSESSDGFLQIGCKCLHISDWLANYKTIGADEGYTESEIEEYGEYIKVFARWYGVEVA